MLKVCILAAGKGSRNHSAKFSNKALLPVFNRAAISLIMDTFPDDTNFIIAVGHNSVMIKDYLELAEFKRNIQICYVDNYDKEGSGPGLSLLSCKEHLQSPFIFTACDTLVREKIKKVSYNWVGTSEVENTENYLILDEENNVVKKFYDKINTKNLPPNITKPYKAFIGMAGIFDYKKFWQSLEKDKSLINNEIQVSNGLNGILQDKVYIKSFSWNDIGTDQLYEDLLKKKDVKVLPKNSETIYFENEFVIKFFSDKEKVTKRLNRAKFIKKALPNNLVAKNNFLRYDFMPGNLLSDQNKNQIFNNFLKFSKKTIWRKNNLSKEDETGFIKECRYFYKIKTLQRVKQFFINSGTSDKHLTINGTDVPPILDTLEKLNWKKIFNKAIPVKFHGDPQPENIIVKDEENFIFLDWRESFGKKSLYGDVYYDLGKIYHALIVSGKVIRDKNYSFMENDNIINLEFLLRENLIRFLRVFEIFLKNEQYDVEHVRLMSAIIFLNIAPLHHDPYNKFVFNYGRFALNNVLSNKWHL